MKEEEEVIEILTAEVVEDLEEPNIDFSKASSKKWPIGTRKKDFPQFTPANREAIIQAMSLGSPQDMAAQFAGVHPDTVRHWMGKGQQAVEKLNLGEELLPVEEDFAEFWIDCTKKSAKAAMGLLAGLQVSARTNPHIGLKLLEKIRPEEFGQRQSIEMKGKVAHGHVHVSGDKLIEGDQVAQRLDEGTLWKMKELIRAEEDRKALPPGEVRGKISVEAEIIEEGVIEEDTDHDDDTISEDG